MAFLHLEKETSSIKNAQPFWVSRGLFDLG
jgi:hypothetical protein